MVTEPKIYQNKTRSTSSLLATVLLIAAAAGDFDVLNELGEAVLREFAVPLVPGEGLLLDLPLSIAEVADVTSSGFEFQPDRGRPLQMGAVVLGAGDNRILCDRSEAQIALTAKVVGLDQQGEQGDEGQGKEETAHFPR